MLQFIKKYFNQPKKSQIYQKNDLNIKEELALAEKSAEEEFHKTEAVKNKIYRSAADLIHEVFDVPAEFWYEELANYERIRNDKRNDSVTTVLKQKCDELVLSYYEQLELVDSKLRFYKQLLAEYQQLRVNLMKSLKKISAEREESALMEILESHKENIGKLHSEHFLDDRLFLNEQQFKLIREELDKTRDELRIKQQVSEEIRQLIHSDDIINKPVTGEYQKEINRLIEKIKSTQDEEK